MARKKKSSGGNTIKTYEDIIRWVSAIVLIACGILLSLGIFGAAGPIGTAAFYLTYSAIGIGAFFLPIGIIAIGLFAGLRRPTIEPITAGGATLLFAAVLSFAGLFPSIRWGGNAGMFIGSALETFFGFWGALVLLLSLALVALAALTDIKIILEYTEEFLINIPGIFLEIINKTLRLYKNKSNTETNESENPNDVQEGDYPENNNNEYDEYGEEENKYAEAPAQEVLEVEYEGPSEEIWIYSREV